jgi:hypothetical protein
MKVNGKGTHRHTGVRGDSKGLDGIKAPSYDTWFLNSAVPHLHSYRPPYDISRIGVMNRANPSLKPGRVLMQRRDTGLLQWWIIGGRHKSSTVYAGR